MMFKDIKLSFWRCKETKYFNLKLETKLNMKEVCEDANLHGSKVQNVSMMCMQAWGVSVLSLFEWPTPGLCFRTV